MSYLLNNLIPDDNNLNETEEQKLIRNEMDLEINTENGIFN
jgi:hypothetical protein